MATALVTGGAGFIGAHLARALLAEGWDVHVADDLSTGSAANVPMGAELHTVDLARGEGIDALPAAHFDAVCHLAGQSSGEKSFDDPGHDLDANARSTVLLGAWARERGVPVFVHASSMGVYGQPDASPVAEDAPLAPLSWYGASKRAAERALDVVARAGGPRCVSLRMFSIYGPGQDLREMRQGMVSIFLAMLLRGEEIVVHGPLDRARDFVYVDDCVEAWLRALGAEQAVGPLNVGTGTATTVGEMVRLLCDLAGVADHPVRSQGTTPGDQFALAADTRRAHALLGWQARTGLGDGLEAMLRWARDGRS